MSGVLVVIAQPRSEGLNQAEGEALGLGRSLADALGEPLACALVGHGLEAAAAEAAERGAAQVLSADADHLATFTGDAVVAAAAEAVNASRASSVIVARGPNALELAPRLGARLGGGCVMGVSEFRPDGANVEVVASVFGGAARAVYRMSATPRVVSLAPGVATAPEREAGRTAETVALDVAPPADARVTVETLEARVGPLLSGEEREDIDTLGGLVFSLTGRVPIRGELVGHPSGLEFEVLETDPRRIKRLRIRNVPPSARPDQRPQP